MRSNSRFAPSSRVPFRPWGRRLALLFALTAACNPDGGDPNNPGNQQGRSQPTLTLVSPEIGAFAGGTSVTVYGTDFRAGATVKFAGAAATQVQVKSNSEMVVTLPAYGGPAGPVEVTVENSDSGRATSASLFSYARVVLQFAPMVTRTVGASPIAIAADDVNGDGGKELLVVNNANSSVSVLLNNLDFNQNGGPYATAALPTSIALGDLNGDGRRDLVVGCSNGSDQGVSVLRGTGNGAFMPSLEKSRALAQSIVEVANGAGLATSALITDMNQVLGRTAGHAVEMTETLAYLTTSDRDPRLHEVVLALGAEMFS